MNNNKECTVCVASIIIIKVTTDYTTCYYSVYLQYFCTFFVCTKEDEKCFCFLDSDGKRTFPDTQKAGDFIVFPSWVQHEVLPNDSNEDRAVIAGNIEFSFMSSDNRIDNQRKLSYSYQVPSTHPGKTITWETYQIEQNSSND